jgi:hypothetical protein
MSKTAMKTVIGPAQDNICELSGVPLTDNPSLLDADRIIERFKGGEYTVENTRVVTPRAHMARHGILRDRPEWMEQLKSIMDDRRQTMNLKQKMENQLLAYQRMTDEANPDTIEFLTDSLEPVKKRLAKIDRQVEKHMKASPDPLVIAAMGVKGVGAITLAGLSVYVDLEKAQSASALWKYVGIHAASHDRYTKGESGGGNKTLRTMLWNMANSMVKNRNCPYRDVYDRTKERLAVSEKVTQSRNTQGQLIECAWKETKPSHRHGAALRAVMKHFLADYWFVGRELHGLSTKPLYVESQLGHKSIIQPQERQWKWRNDDQR